MGRNQNEHFIYQKKSPVGRRIQQRRLEGNMEENAYVTEGDFAAGDETKPYFIAPGYERWAWLEIR